MTAQQSYHRLQSDETICSAYGKVELKRKLGLTDNHCRVLVDERYAIINSLGSGATSSVYLAEDTLLNRRVALKCFPSRIRDTPNYSRIIREARTLAELQDSSIIRIYDVCQEHTHEPFIVMESVAGQTMRQWLAKGPSIRDIIPVFLGVAKGLSAAHNVGVIHRDVKPDNIIITDTGESKIIDFGMAQFAMTERRGDSACSVEGGTPGYMPPEQYFRPADARSDQYSLCATFWEAITGSLPFADNAANIERRLRRPAKMPRWLFRLLRRGLEFNPEHRFGRICDLIEIVRKKGMPASPRTLKRRVALAGFSIVLTSTVILAGIYQYRLTTSEVLSLQASEHRTEPTPKRLVLALQSHASYPLEAKPEWNYNTVINSLSTNYTVSQQQTFPAHVRFGANPTFSPDDQYILTTNDAHAILWNTIPGQQPVVLHDALSGNVVSATFSPLGELVATRKNSNIYIWGLEDTSEPKTILYDVHDNFIGDLVFSDDGLLIAATAEDGVSIWETQSGKEMAQSKPAFIQTYGQHEGLTHISTSGDIIGSTSIYQGFQDLLLWGNTSIHKSLSREYQGPRRLAFFADGMSLAIAYSDRRIMSAMDFSPNGEHLATASADDHQIFIWESSSARNVEVLKGHDAGITHLALSSDGSLVASVDDHSNVKIWNTTDKSAARVPADGLSLVYDIEFSPGDELLAIGSSSGLFIVDTDTLSASRIDGSSNTISLAFSHDGNYLATASADRTVDVWKTSPCHGVPTHSSPRDILGIWSPETDGTRILIRGKSDHFSLWDSVLDSEVTLISSPDSPARVTPSPDGSKLFISHYESNST
ncbi:MAG: protein kinase, partial [Myxococcales bacterium]|nr:protein kinase [Myxococcales bacterium]